MSQNDGYYDPPIAKNGEQSASGDNRTKVLQGEIDQVVSHMQNNLRAAGQRGDNLDALQTKTDDLATQANGFRRGANRVRKQMWWKDMKMRMCIIIGIIILLVIIIVPSVVYSNKN